MARAVCFVLMPFGRKADETGRMIDFDRIYQEAIAPGIADAALLAVRADEERMHGFIHKLMFERLLLSEFAVADLTVANANVYYELGIRHAARPQTTILLMADTVRLPFDVHGLRAVPYALNEQGVPREPSQMRRAISDRLNAMKSLREVDSPLYQLVLGLEPPPFDLSLSDVFRERAAESESLKSRLALAKRRGSQAVDALLEQLGDPATLEPDIAIQFLLAYRAVEAWQRVVSLIGRLDRVVARTVFVREQHAMALNRIGESHEAERELIGLMRERGASSETYGLLGRLYKDRWLKALRRRDRIAAGAALTSAISAYLKGFEMDWRNIYTGINVLTLMDARDPPDPRRLEILPVVRYAARRQLELQQQRGLPADYFQHATLFELTLLADDQAGAEENLGAMLTLPNETWQLQTTLKNTKILMRARKQRAAALPNWHSEVYRRLADEIRTQLKARRSSWKRVASGQ